MVALPQAVSSAHVCLECMAFVVLMRSCSGSSDAILLLVNTAFQSLSRPAVLRTVQLVHKRCATSFSGRRVLELQPLLLSTQGIAATVHRRRSVVRAHLLHSSWHVE